MFGVVKTIIAAIIVVGGLHIYTAMGSNDGKPVEQAGAEVKQMMFTLNSRQKRSTFPVVVEGCMRIASEAGVYIAVSGANSERVCGIYIHAEPDEVIEVAFLHWNISCADRDIVDVIDGWELNGEYFPAKPDHREPVRNRSAEFCKQKDRQVFVSSQNTALVQYKVSSVGSYIMVSVTFRKIDQPCNVLVARESASITLRNYGKRINCTVMALFPAAVQITALNIGGRSTHGAAVPMTESSVPSQYTQCSGKDEVQIGGVEGLNTSLAKTLAGINSVDSESCCQAQSCLNPNGVPGTCKRFQSCEPLLQLHRQYGNGVNDFLQKSICSFDGYDYRVCCTDESANTQNINRLSVNENNRYGPLMPPQCGIADPEKPVRILVVGGTDADLGEWPWLAVLGYKDNRNPDKTNWLCGGSLISNRHVLTAAHCVHGRNDLNLVRLGEHELGSDTDGATPIDVSIQRFSIHPQYNPQIFSNDLAVLKLQRDIEFTRFIRPICLPVTDNLRGQNFVSTFPFIAGWGSLFFTGPRSSVLQKVQVPIVSEAECQQSFKKFKNVTIDDRVACGGFESGGKGACQGDSGGPIMLKQGKAYYAIAVISYGFKCATPGIPGVFTKVNAFLDFILPLLN